MGTAESFNDQPKGFHRVRIMNAMTELVARDGLEAATVSRVAMRAGVSRGAFYELFSDRDACLLAVFDAAVSRASVRLGWAYASGESWLASVRAALLELLLFLDEDPNLASVCVVQSLGGDAALFARRAKVLVDLAAVVDAGRHAPACQEGPPPLTAYGVIAACVSILHGRLLQAPQEPLTLRWGALMALIARPYCGEDVARRELALIVPEHRLQANEVRRGLAAEQPVPQTPKFRVTYRTMRVLGAIAEHPGACSREVAARAGVRDEGQLSKLLARLSGRGLIENTRAGEHKHAEKAWQLTPAGEQATAAMRRRSPAGAARGR